MSHKKIELRTNQNYLSNDINYEEKFVSDLKKIAGYKLTTKILFSEKKFENIILYSLNEKDEKDDNLILEICKNAEDQIYIKTGIYIGEIQLNGITFSILPGLGELKVDNIILYRMLNYANNIFVDKFSDINEENEDSSFLFPLFEYLFLTSLQKSSMLGFPQTYQKESKHDLNFKGKLDIKNYLKKDIPFKGKISYLQMSRVNVQVLIDVLYAALIKVDEKMIHNFSHLGFIKSELKEHFSGIQPTRYTIQLAKEHKVLNNPMFKEFKRTVKFAELVLNHKEISTQEGESDDSFSGYLLDAASLWELYFQGILNKYLPEWNIKAQEKNTLYKDMFYHRNNYPDLVLEKDGKFIIFDAKFKRMKFDYFDVDRTDLFQIHSYIAYYNFMYPNNVIMGGLIYPLLEDIDTKKTHSEKIYGFQEIDSNIKFIVDGICFKNVTDYDSLNNAELDFINRITKETW